MADFVTHGLEFLADVSLRALVLFVLVGIVLRLWRKHDANFQHRAWTAVLWAMLLLPGLTRFTPALSLLPSDWRWQSNDAANAQMPLRAEPALPAQSPVPAASIAVKRLPGPATVPDEIAPLSSPANANDDMARQPAEISVERFPPLPGPEPSSVPAAADWNVDWLDMLFGAYLFGVALLLSRLALGYLMASRLVARARDIPRPTNCRARLAESPAVRMPVTVGLARPVILLPVDWRRWSPALLNSVVAHEQAHIDRRDHLVLLAAEVNRALYWFHPLAWFLRRHLADLAEQCCDDAVIASLGSRGDYARHLVEIAARLTKSRARVAPLGISMARTPRVETRIVAILDERRPLAQRIGRRGALVLAAIVGPIALLAASLCAADPAPQPTADKTAVAAQAPAQAEPEKPPTKGATVRGRVLLAADDSPVAGAEVRLLINDADGYRASERDMASDAQGNFVFDNVPDGSHRMVAVTTTMASRRARIDPTWAKVVKGADPEPVVMKLWPAPSIKVRVTRQSDGKPLAGAVVRLAQTGRSQTTDAAGEAVLVGLTPEHWEVRGQADGFAFETAEVRLKGTEQAQIELALVPGGKIHGTVKDREGSPLAKTDVNLRWESDAGVVFDTARTDGEGRFHFDFVPLGETVELNTGGDPYLHEQEEVSVPADGNRDVEVNLVLERRPKGGSVQGLVTDRDRKPIAGASVTNGWRRSRDRRETFTTAAGRFKLDDVSTGNNGTFVVVRAKGFAPQVVEFTPGPADNPQEIGSALGPGHRVRGRVVDFANKPIAGAWVSYDSEGFRGDEDIGGDVQTDADGRFEFDSLPARCSFNVGAQGYSRTGDIRLALDDAQEAVVKLRPEGFLRGRVINAATNKPVTKFRLRLDRSPDRRPDDPEGGVLGRYYRGQQIRAVDGQFTIDDLTADCPLQVTVDADGFDATSLRRVLPRPAGEAEAVEIKLGPINPATIDSIAGTIVDAQGKPKGGAQLRLVVFEAPPGRQRLGYNWNRVGPERARQIEGVLQFLSTASAPDGSFHFDDVRLDKRIEMVWWGDGVPEGRKERMEKLSKAERQAIRIESPAPGAIAGKIKRQTYPDLFRIDIIHQGVGAMDQVEFWNQPDKADYEFDDLTPGDYLLTIQVREPVGAKRRAGAKNIETQRVTVKAGETTTLNLGFDAAPEAAPAPTTPAPAAAAPANPLQPIDQPADEQIVVSGRVVDGQGNPVPDALVSMMLGYRSGKAAPEQPPNRRTDATGQFNIPLTRGWLARTDDMSPAPALWAYAPGHALGALSIESQLAERKPGPIELILGPATDTAFQIVDPQGKPVAGAKLEPQNVTPKGTNIPLAPDEISEVASGTSDADGIARLPAIDLGSLKALVIKAPGFGLQVAHAAADSAEDAPTKIALRPVGRLEVQVTRSSPGDVAGVNVWLLTRPEWTQPGPRPRNAWWIMGRAVGVTDENGVFVAPELAEGAGGLSASVDPSSPLRAKVPDEVQITAGQTTRVEIPLVPAQRVRGMVRTNADGKPVAGVTVRLHHSMKEMGQPEREMARTDADGRFEALVLPGKVAQHIITELPTLMEDSGPRWQEEEVPAHDGVFELKPIELVTTKTIVGRLVDQFNRPVGNMFISAIGDARGNLASATTNPDGSFSLQVPADAEPDFSVRGRMTGFLDAEVGQRDPLVLRARLVPTATGKKP